MKYKVKYNDDGVKIDAILRIKDDSFVVTYIDYVVNVHYEDIENITYNNNTLKISENGNEHVIYCSEEAYNAIESRCDNNDIDIEESMQVETVFDSKKENIEKSKKYKALVFLPDGQSECNLSLTTKDLVIDDGIDILRIPISAIIRVILEDNNNIKVLSNGNKNIVIKSNKYKELYSELKKLKDKIPHNSNSSIIVKDVFGNTMQTNTKIKTTGNHPIIFILGIILFSVIIGLIILPSNSSDNGQHTNNGGSTKSMEDSLDDWNYNLASRCAQQAASRYGISNCSSFEQIGNNYAYVYRCGRGVTGPNYVLIENGRFKAYISDYLVGFGEC